MALNISFNPIYDFDKGFDFTSYRWFTPDVTGSSNCEIETDAFATETLDNHFVILIMRNTSLQTLPQDWDRSLQDLEDGFMISLHWIDILKTIKTIKSIWTCLIICSKVSRNFHSSTWKKFELFSFKIIYFWNRFLIQFSISSNQGRFRTLHYLWIMNLKS